MSVTFLFLNKIYLFVETVEGIIAVKSEGVVADRHSPCELRPSRQTGPECNAEAELLPISGIVFKSRLLASDELLLDVGLSAESFRFRRL